MKKLSIAVKQLTNNERDILDKQISESSQNDTDIILKFTMTSFKAKIVNFLNPKHIFFDENYS